MKKLVIAAAALVCATAVYFGVKANSNTGMDLLAQNIEALANPEQDDIKYIIRRGSIPCEVTDSYGNRYSGYWTTCEANVYGGSCLIACQVN